MNGARNSTILLDPPLWDPGEGSKGQISLNFILEVNFKDLYTPQIKDIKHIKQACRLWHIKLKGVMSRTEYKMKFHPGVKLGILGWGQNVKYH